MNRRQQYFRMMNPIFLTKEEVGYYFYDLKMALEIFTHTYNAKRYI